MGLRRDIVQSVSLTIYHDHGELLVRRAMSLGYVFTVFLLVGYRISSVERDYSVINGKTTKIIFTMVLFTENFV